MIAHVARREDGSAEVRFPFDRRLIEMIKLMIPAGRRSWHPDAKHWTVQPPYVGEAERLLRQRFGAVLITEAPGPFTAGPTPIRQTDPDFAALHLLPSAPPALVATAYKVLAKTQHPDTGGDTAHMQALNVAYGRLKAKGAA